MSPPRLPIARLRQLTAYRTVSDAGYAGLEEVIREHAGISAYLPSPVGAHDARERLPVLYSEARLHRPHDTGERETPSCPICEGKLTPVVDRGALSRGAGETFITPNLYPIITPSRVPITEGSDAVGGMHFVQWNSNRHDLDLRNMKPADIVVLLERLAAFEEVLLFDPGAGRTMSAHPRRHRGKRIYGHVGIIKNVGAPVGGSLVHGHQQIAHLSTRPRAYTLDAAASVGPRRHDQVLRDETPRKLRLRSYPGRIQLLVPAAARRPLQACIVGAESERSFLHELTPRMREGVAHALRDVCHALHRELPAMGRVVSYNLVFHTHPACGFLIEVLPFSQEEGGYERLGVYLSHARPETSADLLRRSLP